MAFEIGDTVGDYQIIGVLGAGGMGKVYKVKNTISERIDAMKVLLPSLSEDQELADRFTREIKVLASLNHPNIAGLRTAFRQNDQLLMLMEFVEGKTLDDMVKAGPIPVPDAVNYIVQVLGALGYAHKHGVVHRDIKPANMMLTTEGVIKLMDFGIAKTKNDRKLTQTGGTLGSLFYMSTEQVQGEELDGRSDLYSVGVSLYEMVTGARPFKGKSEFDIMIAQLQQAPVPPIQMMPDLPKALNDIIVLALEKDKNKRFQTAEAFSAALSSVTGQALNATPMRPGGTAVMPTVVMPEVGTATAAFGGQEPPHQPTAYMAAATASQAAVPTVIAPAPVPPAPDPSHGVPEASTGSKGYRGLYMTLGALIALAVIVLGATQIPRFMKTHAGSDQTAQANSSSAPNSSAPASGTTGSTTAAPSSTPDSTAAGSGAATNGAGAPGTPAATDASFPASGAAAGSTGGAAAPSTGTTAAPSSAPGNSQSPSSAGHSGKSAGHGAMNGAAAPGGLGYSPTGGQASAASTPAATNGSGQTVPSAAPAAASNAQEMVELTDLHDKLSARAVTVDGQIENLRRQMASSGNSLRGDIAASQTRMKMDMNNFDKAMNTGDAAAARKYMSMAEHEVDALEKFLGN